MPTLTAHEGMDPQPRVDVLFDVSEFDPSVDLVTVYQISADGTRAVRDAILESGVGGFAVTDYEVPPGISVAYRAQQFDADGLELGYTDSASVTVGGVPAGWAVFSDPLAPSRAVLVRFEMGAMSALSNSRQSQTYRVGTDTITLKGELSLLENVPIRVFTETDAAAVSLFQILAEGDVLIRTISPVPLPRAFYASFATLPREPFDAHEGGEWKQWNLTATEVSRTVLGALIPDVTYERYNDFFATYTAFNAAKATYLEHIAEPPPEA